MTYFKQKEYILANAKCLTKSNVNLKVGEDFSKPTIDIRNELWKTANAVKNTYKDDTYEITYVKLAYRNVILSYKNKAADKYFSRSFTLRDMKEYSNWYVPQHTNYGAKADRS